MWKAQVLAATKSVDALSALRWRSAGAFRASAVWTILSASLPSSRRMGGSSILTTLNCFARALGGAQRDDYSPSTWPAARCRSRHPRLRSCAADMLGQRIAESAGRSGDQPSRDAHIKCSFRMRAVAPQRPQVLAATKSVDALSALHLRSAAAFRASAVWTILSASL